jgi:hypothetical protein
MPGNWMGTPNGGLQHGWDENKRRILATVGLGLEKTAMESYSHGQGMSNLPGEHGGR